MLVGRPIKSLAFHATLIQVAKDEKARPWRRGKLERTLICIALRMFVNCNFETAAGRPSRSSGCYRLSLTDSGHFQLKCLPLSAFSFLFLRFRGRR